MFAVMRFITFLGGLAWLQLRAPVTNHSQAEIVSLFSIFFVYSTLMYVYIFLNARSVNTVYKRIMFFDLLFISFLVHFSGGWKSDFFLAYYILIGLHSFYFNMGAGLKIASTAAGLYLLAIKDNYSEIFIGDLGLRLSLLFAVAVPTGVLSTQMRRTAQHLKSSYLATVEALLECLNNKDTYTGKHSQRVAYFATRLAEEIGLCEEDIQNIQIAGYLHDIGKIGIPETILLKPDKLTEDEWDIVRKHPEFSENIVMPLNLSNEVKQMVRQHHERYDGTGYPDKISGTQILLGARILAIADAYEAMTAERPYRRAFTEEKALQEILGNAERQFDPALAKTFLHLYEKMHTKGEKNIIDLAQPLQETG